MSEMSSDLVLLVVLTAAWILVTLWKYNMGVPKRLTRMQTRFAEFIVFGGTEGPMTQAEAAVAAGYSTKRSRQEGSELLNPNLSPLVVEHVEKLKAIKVDENKILKGQLLIEFNSIVQKAKEGLKKDLEKRNYHKTLHTANKFREILGSIGQDDIISVYLAEETRPYKTDHYKIGKTLHNLESRSSGRTDNPFGLNYICYFEYLSKNGFNLEKTLHSFFRHFSTYNSTYDTSASEWFTIKNRKNIIKYFKKVGGYLLEKHGAMARYIKCENGGYYKKWKQ